MNIYRKTKSWKISDMKKISFVMTVMTVSESLRAKLKF